MKVTIDGAVIEGTPEEIKEMMTLMGAEFPVKNAEETFEVIEETPQFKEGDRVKVLVEGEFGDIEAGEIGEVTDTDAGLNERDQHSIEVTTEHEEDYFRPQDIELVTEEEVEEGETGEQYKPTVGDIVVITANTNSSRNKVGDIGKVGKISVTDGDATVDVPERPEGQQYHGNWTRLSEMRPATDEEKAQYEQAVKKAEFKVGDYAKVITSVHEYDKGDIVKIVGDRKSGHAIGFDFKVEFVKVTGINKLNGQTYGFIDAKNIVKATDEEVKFAKLDRNPGEFKKGDIVRVTKSQGGHEVGTVGELVSGESFMFPKEFGVKANGKTFDHGKNIELIAPVESRLDR